MCNRRDNLFAFFRVAGPVVVAGLLSQTSQSGSFCRAAELASNHVQAALEAEIDRDVAKREELLEAALRANPNSAEAHWARGEVQLHGRWITLEDSAENMLAEPELLKYWEKRAAAGKTVEDQVRLAEYCKTHRMPAQERAHWNAVTALDPNHREARKKLGQVGFNGKWIERQQLEQQKKKEAATYAYLQKHGKRLMALSMALHDKSKSKETVLKELAEFDSPMVIPGLEYCFSSTDETGGRCAVETVAKMGSPEASLSLARHALEFPNLSVREDALNYLKDRDELSFVPALLSELQTRIKRFDGLTINADNQLVWRQTLFTETQDTKRIATFDKIFQLPGRGTTSFNPRWALGAIARADVDVEVMNAAIDSKNKSVMELLARTTGDQSSQTTITRRTPEDWWNWWNERIESYPSEKKSIDSRYDVSYGTITFPPPPVPRHECLAAGTLIWTETGPVDVDVLKVGDVVLTQNHRTGELKFAPVMTTTTRPPEVLLQIKFKDEVVRATGGHPFWVNGKGWVKSRSLEPGMALHTARGFVVIDSIEEEKDATETFNLIVDECHSYFVGKNLILSHDNSSREPVATRVPGLR